MKASDIFSYKQCGKLTENLILVPTSNPDIYLLQILSSNKLAEKSYEWKLSEKNSTISHSKDDYFNLYIGKNNVNQVAELWLTYFDGSSESFNYDLKLLDNVEEGFQQQVEKLNEIRK